jgi:hypothetical protein
VFAGGGPPPPLPPTSCRSSVLAFEPDARERGLQEPGVPIAGFDHEGDGHASQHGELVDDRPCGGGWGGLGLGLGRHARVELQRGCHTARALLRRFSRIRSCARRKWMQDARKRMIVTVSGGAERRASWTASTLDLQAVAQRPLAGRTPRGADLLMVSAAGAGGFFLGVAGAAIPNTFPKRHAGSFPPRTRIPRRQVQSMCPWPRARRRIVRLCGRAGQGSSLPSFAAGARGR